MSHKIGEACDGNVPSFWEITPRFILRIIIMYYNNLSSFVIIYHHLSSFFLPPKKKVVVELQGLWRCLGLLRTSSILYSLATSSSLLWLATSIFGALAWRICGDPSILGYWKPREKKTPRNHGTKIANDILVVIEFLVWGYMLGFWPNFYEICLGLSPLKATVANEGSA